MAQTATALATASQVRDHYDELSWLYRAFWGNYLHHGFFSKTDNPREAQLALLEFCTRLLPFEPSGAILDAGCGYGTSTLFLARRFHCRAEGVSVSPRQVAYALRLAKKSKLNGRLTFSVADIADFKYPNAPYDLIWAMESTEHFADKQQFFDAAARALRPGGAMLVAAWTAGPTASEVDVRRVAEASVCPSFITAEDYQQLITGAGMAVLHSRDITSEVAHTWDIVESRVRWFRPFAPILPRSAHEFSEAIPLIRRAFQTGVLTYTVVVAQRVAM